MSLLLCHIANSVGTSTEDIATMSLHYLLQSSTTARDILLDYIGTELGLQFEKDLHFELQSCGENLERPDMSLRNSHNDEILIFEMKFWAALTDNQPNTYLERLKKKGGNGLVFVCPKSRIISLVDELATSANYEKHQGRLLQKDGNPPMLVLSWEEVLTKLENILQGDTLYNDLLQLKGLTGEMDNQDFKPFTAGDLNVNMANRIIDYYRIVDKIADSLLIHKICNSKGLKASPQKCGYYRYLKIDNPPTGLSIQFNCNLWQKGICGKTTPFWITFKSIDENNNWGTYPAKLRYQLDDKGTKYLIEKSDKSDMLIVPLYPKFNTNEFEMVDNLIKQAKDLIDLL